MAIITAIVSYFAFRALLFQQAFQPVTLDAREEAALQAKLEQLESEPQLSAQQKDGDPSMEPEPYRERAADRTVRFTEKELNAILAKHTDLADKVSIDLSPGLVSAKLRIPMDEDAPFDRTQPIRKTPAEILQDILTRSGHGPTQDSSRSAYRVAGLGRHRSGTAPALVCANPPRGSS